MPGAPVVHRPVDRQRANRLGGCWQAEGGGEADDCQRGGCSPVPGLRHRHCHLRSLRCPFRSSNVWEIQSLRANDAQKVPECAAMEQSESRRGLTDAQMATALNALGGLGVVFVRGSDNAIWHCWETSAA